MNNERHSYTRPTLRTHWRARSSRIIRQWPILLWVGMALLCAFLHHRSPHPQSDTLIHGIVDAEAVAISPVETARIKAIHVKTGQQVRKGDILVEMDTSLIAHGVTSDMLDAISIESAFGDTHQDLLQAVSQRFDAVAELEGEIAYCQQEWERERAELTALQTEQARREKLHRDKMIDPFIRSELLPDISALEKAVGAYSNRIALYEKQLVHAQSLQKGIIDWLGMKPDESISDAISRRLDESRVLPLIGQAKSEAAMVSQAYTLVAPNDGTISEILCHEGEVIASDIPILRLVNTSPTLITAYLGENQVAGIQEGQQFLVQSTYRHTSSAVIARVEFISPAVHQATLTVSSTGKEMFIRSQRARLRIIDSHSFLGGEAVQIRAPIGRFSQLLDRLFGTPGQPAAMSTGA